MKSILNFVCLLINEIYKTYQTVFLFRCLGHAPGVGLLEVQGVGRGYFFPEFNHIWCVSYSHEWHMQRHKINGPRPLGPWGGAKRSNIIKFQLLSQLQIILNQLLCVFSQIKDIKHIRRDFYSVTWVMPQGTDFGGTGGGGHFFLSTIKIGVWVTHMNGTCNGTIFWAPTPLGPLEGAKKVKCHSISITQSISNNLKNKLCVFLQIKYMYTKHFRFSFDHLGHALGVMLGGQNFNFLNKVMWQIKLKGIISRPGYKKIP